MITREQARKLRSFLEAMSENATDEEALDNIMAFPKWTVGIKYEEEDVQKARVRYNDKLYKVIQAHTTQADWTPDITPALYMEISLEEWPEWKQPIGSEDAYPKDAKVSYNGKHWISNTPNNVWEPGVYGWDEQ